MGSVKDIEVLKEPTKGETGIARFTFSDRYSVFDWGRMPDLLSNKGSALAVLGAYFFEKAEEKGIPTHYIGLVEDGKVKKLSDIKKPTDIMEVKLLQVIRPALQGNQYDYSIYRHEKGCFLIPFEIIYRNYLPSGSSVFERLKEGKITPEELGLDGMPSPGQKLDKPIMDVSTKLEITDRYLTWKEVQQISGLLNNEIEGLKKVTNEINTLITREFSKIGLINEDGKIEFGFDQERHLIVVDVFGTLDECRFTYNGITVSKEIARRYYRRSEWYQEVLKAKERDRHQWKQICRLAPQPLPIELKELISQIYCACTNEITENEWFRNVPPLKKILKKLRKFFEEQGGKD